MGYLSSLDFSKSSTRLIVLIGSSLTIIVALICLLIEVSKDNASASVVTAIGACFTSIMAVFMIWKNWAKNLETKINNNMDLQQKFRDQEEDENGDGMPDAPPLK